MTTETRPAVYARHRAELQQLQQRFDSLFEGEDVLDVGCGKVLAVDVAPSAHVVGMDVSADSMAGNANVDEAFVGDVQHDLLPPESFDAVLCWDVLEHVPDPTAALDNMQAALRPGGVLVLGTPNVWSVKGLVTKFTPHRFHVWAYRRLLGRPDAGKPGRAPFPTYLRLVLAPRPLSRLLRARGLQPELQILYRSDVGARLPGPLPRVWAAAMATIRMLTFGRIDPELSEAAYLFRKPPLPARARTAA